MSLHDDHVPRLDQPLYVDQRRRDRGGVARFEGYMDRVVERVRRGHSLARSLDRCQGTVLTSLRVGGAEGMLMLVLTAFVEIAIGDREAIVAALPQVIASTRAEDGCEDYGCYEDAQSPGRFVFVERWRDKAALDRHLATPHMAAWMKIAGPRMRSARGFLYEVSSSTELKPK